MIESATTNSVIGRRGNSRSPKTISARAPSPTPRLARLVSPRCRSTPIVRVKKLLPPLLMPNNFGSWVEAITRPAPSLNPLSTVSETKLAMVPKRSVQAMMPIKSCQYRDRCRQVDLAQRITSRQCAHG